MNRRSAWKNPVAVLLTAIMLFPVYWMVNVSFTRRDSIRNGDLLPLDFTLDHYATVLRTQLPHLATSVLVGLGTVILTLVIAAPASYGLAKLRFPGGRPMEFFLIVAQMVPAVVMALGFYSVYNRLGILNTVPGLILADSTIAVPFAVMLLTAFMRGIPRELIEAAKVDGATTWQAFTRVVLPISRNSLITAALFGFLWAWSDFLFASTLNRDGGNLRPITLGIYDYIGAQNQEWGPMMATAVVASLPATVLLVLAQRFVAAGVTAGAVKD
ncbi:MAG TPA: carbohydrate ABC transporter permease [Arachnia sp.]|nr:carbohydrate ABC transporter permease [Arachnia sp.]HMT85291.1 carbohydrate ABC transporter permease [Arachnia sp.]